MFDFCKFLKYFLCSIEKNILYAKNNLHTYITSTSDLPNDQPNNSELPQTMTTVPTDEIIKSTITDVINESNVPSDIPATQNTELNKTKHSTIDKEEILKEILNERNRFLKLSRKNPLYANEHFQYPWKVVSK